MSMMIFLMWMCSKMEVDLRIIIQEDVLIKNLILPSLNGMVGKTYSFSKNAGQLIK